MAYDGSPNERKQVQYDVLTYKVDTTTNDKMVYKSNAVLNKGLNPDYFTGNDTKIVNSLNKLYKMIVKCNTTAERVSDKYNPIILDTELTVNKPILEAMRKATGKDTLIESVLALAKGEIGGLAVLNPTDAEDGFVITFDKQQNKFVLKPPTEAIEQNLILFNSQTEKDKYITLDNCKVGQVGYFNKEYYRVTATNDTKEIISKKANYVIHNNKTVSADLSIKDAENINLIDAAANFVIEVRDIEINKTYTLVLDKDASVSVTPVSSKGNAGTSAHTMTTNKKLEFSTTDGTVTKIYVDIASNDASGKNDVNAKVATEFATVPVCEWKPLIDVVYKKTEGTLVEVGGVPKGYVPNGSIGDILDAMLYPEVAPKITLAPQAHQVLVLEKGIGSTQNVKFDLSFEKTKNKIEKIVGIVNGTTNYILSNMTESNMSFDKALCLAKENGFAEFDPTDDIEGFDAAYKLSIMSSLSFEAPVHPNNILREGISNIRIKDINYAKKFGYVIKLLAIGTLKNNSIEVRVHPAFVPKNHPFASVKDSFNAVYLKGNAVGDLTIYGKGAGDLPTGSAIVSDLLSILRNNLNYCGINQARNLNNKYDILPSDEIESEYYIRLNVKDKPGIIGDIGTLLGENNISISLVTQDIQTKHQVDLIFLTQKCKEKSINNFKEKINNYKNLNKLENIITIENLNN